MLSDAAKKRGDEPAYPCSGDPAYPDNCSGLTIREDLIARYVPSVIVITDHLPALKVKDLVEEASEYADANAEEMVFVPGGAEFLRGVAPLRQMAAKDKLDSSDRSEILTWHNQSIELFNRIVLKR